MHRLEKFKNKELIVRKHISGFLEKLLLMFNSEFDHDRYKKVIYGEDKYNGKFEENIKSYYDAYVYLLSNHKNPLTNKILSRFFYLFLGREMDNYILIRITSKLFEYIDLPSFEGAVDFHMYVYSQLLELNEEERTIVSLMLFNYVLLKKDIPTINIFQTDYMEYRRERDNYLIGDKTKLYEVLLKIIKDNEFQEKSYYKNLSDLTLEEIYKSIYFDKDELKQKYKIKGISIFGSFAKGLERFDSDIDLLISFSLDLTAEEKSNFINEIRNHYQKTFKRLIDITELSEYLNDDFINRITYVKKIF